MRNVSVSLIADEFSLPDKTSHEYTKHGRLRLSLQLFFDLDENRLLLNNVDPDPDSNFSLVRLNTIPIVVGTLRYLAYKLFWQT